MAPAPMAMTASAAATGVSRPSVAMTGARMPAVVVMATVEEPWAVLRMAASRNGKKMPMASSAPAWLLMKFTMSVEAMTLPRTPPAAVMNRMGPTTFRVSWHRS